MPIASINPATGELVKSFRAMTSEEIESHLQSADSAQRRHRDSTFEERKARMNALAGLLQSEVDRLAALITLEVGKTIASSRAEVLKCASGCRYYAEHAAQMLKDEPLDTGTVKSFVRYEPLGVVLAIMPWNFPFWQVFRFAAPAIMAGNAGLLKHSSNVPHCSIAIEDLFRRAGFEEGVFQSLLAVSDQIPAIIADRRIAAVTLTGSEGAGMAVAAEAGRHIKKTVLELGGSDPFIVMQSADMDKAISTAVTARTINNGQSCIAAKRFIVHKSVYQSFAAGFVEAMTRLKVGDPMDPANDIGPLATPQIRKELDEQVRRSVELGARLLLGGHTLPGPGNYYEATVLADVPAGSPAYSQELFGPVAAIFAAEDIEDAIRIANDVEFGLGCSVWTNNPIEQRRFIDSIRAGMVFVNSMVASDPRVPFGGIKKSGYGRELSKEGIREFVNIKTVWNAEG